LAGKRIVITRAPAQAEELASVLEQHGAEVVLMPTVCFAPVENSESLDSAIENVKQYDWILFASANAVRFFCRRCRDLSTHVKSLQSSGPSVGAVGPATSNTALAEGLRVDYVARKHDGKSLARELAGSIQGRKVLLPRSDRSDDRLPVALREAGARVTEVITYRTTVPASLDAKALNRVRHAEVDAIVFASPSAFNNLSRFLSVSDLADLSRRIQFAAIGSTTASALRGAGIRVAIEASESSAEVLAEAIVNFYQHHAATARIT
jgi:uroporphyrinogen III methyltransferase/synthase